VAGA
jgi:hypothetical protein